MWALPRRGTHKKNLLSIKVDISGVYSFNCNVFDLVFVAKSIFEVRKYGFVAHMLTWPTRVRGTLHVDVHLFVHAFVHRHQPWRVQMAPDIRAHMHLPG